MKPRPSTQMRRFSADVDRAIENNGAVTLPAMRGTESYRHGRVVAWFIGAAIVGSALLRRRVRS